MSRLKEEQRQAVIKAVAEMIDYSDTYRNDMIAKGLTMVTNTSSGLKMTKIPPMLFYKHMSVLSGKYYKYVRELCKKHGYTVRWKTVKEEHSLWISLRMDLTEAEETMLSVLGTSIV